jgi:sugar lactone lactonase YvrE
VTISVLARGQAPVTFQWKKDGVALTNGGVVSGATSATLTLTGVTNTETATYTVDVNNALGPLVTSTASVLNVNAVPPSFTTQPPATQTVVAGATATITFVAAGTPTPTYQWKKNGVNLTDGGNVSGSTSTTLTLTNVSPADTATYTVVADNTIAPSATSNNSVLNVNVPSAITTQPPATLTVNVGGTATITAAASGIPTPTYQWQKNGVNISGATSATLTLTPLVIGDAGTYKVIATNVAGVATSSNSVLTVNYPPSYTTQPAATQTINAGGSVTFTAAASGVPTPTYQWQKNGVNITGATNATLTINSLVPGDAGTYTVITTNSLGAVTSSNAVLTVNYAPVITAQPAAAQTINVGNSVTYSVTVAGSPAPTYQWQKNSVDIVGATSSTLTLSGLALTDSGTYTVTATNSLGNATSNNAVLTVVLGFAPVFTTSPVGATILLNNPITFTAAATGTPAPTFQWQKDGVAITGATGTSYTIPSVQATDGGVYTVVATNIVGPVTSAGATLVVNLVPPPAISAQPKSLTVASGHSVSFQAGATNGAAYQWQVSADGGASWNAVSNSSTYSGSTTSTLTVTGASTSMNGYQYRVVATNSTSTVTSAAATLAVVTPVFPSPVDVAPNSKGNVLVDDSGTDVIQSVSSAGVATLLAGSAGKPGSTDDNGSYASFRVPGGFVLDSSGNLYLADTGNNLIRKITADGSVTTIAGQPGFQGFQDGAGSAAWFNLPGGITIDGSGNLYVADTGNSIIRKITPGGATVSTVAGSPSLRGTTNGTGSAARFNQPYGITSDSAGNLYVADTLNQTIRKITPAGVVTTFAGAPGVSGSADGNGLTDALFNHPLGITIDAAGNLYVSDSGNNTIRLIKPDGTVSTLAGLPTIAGLKDGTGTDAWFNQPIGVRLDSAGTTLYVADNGNAAIRRVTLAGAVTTWAITQGTSAPSTPNPTPTPTPTTSGGSTNLPPSSTGGGGGAFDGWFIAALSVLSIMRWRRRPA